MMRAGEPTAESRPATEAAVSALPEPVDLFETTGTPPPTMQIDNVLPHYASSSISNNSFHHFCGPQLGPSKPKKPSSPHGRESLMVVNRRTTRVDFDGSTSVYVDCGDALPRGEVGSIKKKAIQLEMSYISTPAGPVTFFGQAGILMDGNTKMMYTAKHNVADEHNMATGKVMEFLAAVALRDGSQKETTSFNARQLELTKAKPLLLRAPKIEWKYGWDTVTIGRRPYFFDPSFWHVPQPNIMLNLSEVKPENMFEMVRPDFTYEKGQKVAIVVSSVGLKQTATPETANVGRQALKIWLSSIAGASAEGIEFHQESFDWLYQPATEAETEYQKKMREAVQFGLEDIYGPGDTVSIYTGETTHVGIDHIEYDINTYKSCSGAIVFLLPVNEQPESVKPQDLGKAIAVHVGYHELLGDQSDQLGTETPSPILVEAASKLLFCLVTYQ